MLTPCSIYATIMSMTTPPFTAIEQEAFTYGDCWLLARALHNITGWQMVAVGNTGGKASGVLRDWAHMAVRTPQGTILDITGTHDDKDILDVWSEQFSFMSAEQGVMEVFDVAPEDWFGLTEEQIQMYPEVDPSSTAQRLLAYYIEAAPSITE